MTTIGYGNAAPVSAGSQTLVYTAGFLSILAFGGLVGQAGVVILAIVDHTLRSSARFNRLARGLPSVCYGLRFFFCISCCFQESRSHIFGNALEFNAQE